MDRIATATALSFPSGSQLLEFYEVENVFDPVWVAKISMPLKSLRDFQTELQSKTDEKTSYSGALADSTAWWTPKNVVLVKQYLANPHTFVRIVLSEEEGQVIAFIECAIF